MAVTPQKILHETSSIIRGVCLSFLLILSHHFSFRLDSFLRFLWGDSLIGNKGKRSHRSPLNKNIIYRIRMKSQENYPNFLEKDIPYSWFIPANNRKIFSFTSE
jgi:hypothetical protein